MYTGKLRSEAKMPIFEHSICSALFLFAAIAVPKALSFSSNSLHIMTVPFHKREASTSVLSSAASPSAAYFQEVKAVIFDVDGTLADSGQLGFDATLVVLLKYNFPAISYADYCEGCRYTTPDRLARHAGLTPEKDYEAYHALGQKLGQEFDDLYINLVSMETAPFFSGMLDLVYNIPSTVRVGALTNAAGRYAHAVLKVNDNTDDGFLYQRFESILGADQVPKPKPFADGLLQVCRELNVDPAYCVYIGDSPSDGLAAVAAGMPAVGVTWGAHSADSLLGTNRPRAFSYICSTVDELASMLPQQRLRGV